MKEINVIGTMQLLAACQKASGVQRLVVKSTSSVYGASPKDPAQFTEDTAAKVLPRAGWGKDSVEVEGYVRGFSRRRPDVDVAVLRFANAVGPGMRTALTDYFSRFLLESNSPCAIDLTINMQTFARRSTKEIDRSIASNEKLWVY